MLRAYRASTELAGSGGFNPHELRHADYQKDGGENLQPVPGRRRQRAISCIGSFSPGRKVRRQATSTR
jgi:hypothetical protein